MVPRAVLFANPEIARPLGMPLRAGVHAADPLGNLKTPAAVVALPGAPLPANTGPPVAPTSSAPIQPPSSPALDGVHGAVGVATARSPEVTEPPALETRNRYTYEVTPGYTGTASDTRLVKVVPL